MLLFLLDKIADAIQNGLMDSKCYSSGVKIRSYKVRKSGRGMVITLPVEWTGDLKLQPGDTLDLFRDTENRLILAPADGKGGDAA